MSKQKFTSLQREALWSAHSRKCVYTGELLDLRNMHIDHILPESLATNTAELNKLKEALHLPADFDLFGYENLLPCTQAANLQKGSATFDPNGLRYFLNIAMAKKATVEKNITLLEMQLEKGKAVILLDRILASGKASPEELMAILEKHQSKPKEAFKLLEALTFVDQHEVSLIAKNDIEDLRSLPIKLGENDHIDGVTLHNDQDQTVYVRTCKEYDEAISAGYYPLTTFAIKMATFFEHQCGLLNSLAVAHLPEKSFIADPYASILDLNLLPFSMFPSMSDRDKEEPSSTLSYQDMVDEGRLKIKTVKNNFLVVELPGAMGQQLIEVARADFNGDGIEDILLFEYGYALGGSFGYGTTKIITRLQAGMPFKVIKTI